MIHCPSPLLTYMLPVHLSEDISIDLVVAAPQFKTYFVHRSSFILAMWPVQFQFKQNLINSGNVNILLKYWEQV